MLYEVITFAECVFTLKVAETQRKRSKRVVYDVHLKNVCTTFCVKAIFRILIANFGEFRNKNGTTQLSVSTKILRK